MISVVTSREEPCFVQIEAHQAGVYQIGRGRSENRRKKLHSLLSSVYVQYMFLKTLVQGVFYTVLSKILVSETLGK